MKPSHTTRKALRWQIFWIGTIGGLGGFDAWRAGKHDGSTLSEVTREIFRTNQPPGRVVFAGALGAGAAALAVHILREQAT